MSSKCKRARRSIDTSINALPEEVMVMIFDQLCVHNLKRAALTCHRWNNIIFMSNFASRFYLNIDARNKDAVAMSKRWYRKIKWVIPDVDNLPIWDTIYTKMNNLHSLEISPRKDQSIASAFALIADSIPLMAQLRSLTLIDSNVDSPDQETIPTLRSNSINSLTFISNFKIRVDMPELQTYEGYLFALGTPDECIRPTALAKLKTLIVTRNDSAKSIFRRMTSLEKMVWIDDVEYDICKAICEHCPTHLRSLEISRLRLRLGTSHMNSVLDWSNLTQIEHLILASGVLDAIKLPKSLKKLEVVIDDDNEESMIETIISGAAHLKELTVQLNDPRGNEYDYDEPVELLKALSHLKLLEVLVFHGGRFLKSSFLRMNAPLVHVRKLQFNGAELLSSKSIHQIVKISIPTLTFRTLKKKFPNLKEPEFADCTLISDKESDSEYVDYDNWPSGY